MCGITGFFDTSGNKSSEQLTQTARRMATSLRHRGPEDEGVWVDPATGIALAHRRLSIIDLSPMGHQPMHSACSNARSASAFGTSVACASGAAPVGTLT